jgi:hypothetical protein
MVLYYDREWVLEYTNGVSSNTDEGRIQIPSNIYLWRLTSLTEALKETIPSDIKIIKFCLQRYNSILNLKLSCHFRFFFIYVWNSCVYRPCQFSFYLLYFNNIDHYKNIIIIKHYKNIIIIKEEHRKPIFTCIKIYSDLRL